MHSAEAQLLVTQAFLGVGGRGGARGPSIRAHTKPGIHSGFVTRPPHLSPRATRARVSTSSSTQSVAASSPLRHGLQRVCLPTLDRPSPAAAASAARSPAGYPLAPACCLADGCRLSPAPAGLRGHPGGTARGRSASGRHPRRPLQRLQRAPSPPQCSPPTSAAALPHPPALSRARFTVTLGALRS